MSAGTNSLLAGLGAFLLQARGAAMQPALYEYLLVGIGVVVLVWVFYLAIRATVRPGEEEPDHIKRLVLEDGEKKRHG